MVGAKKDAKSDPDIEKIREVLAEYMSDHPNAKVDIQRQNSVSIRIRIVSPDFKGMDRVDRDTALWKFLDRLPEEVISNITFLLLLTPQETAKSLANMDFENPIPSRL